MRTHPQVDEARPGGLPRGVKVEQAEGLPERHVVLVRKVEHALGAHLSEKRGVLLAA